MRTDKTIVSIKNIRSDIFAAIREAMELANWQFFIDVSKSVVLKPNLGWDFYLPGSISSPWFVEGVIKVLRDKVKEIYMVESDQVLVSADRALHATHIDKICKKYNIPWINMSKGKFVKVSLDKAFTLKNVEIPEVLARTQLVTLPLLKTHGKTTITGAIKNQWGCLRELRHNYHLVVNKALADLNRIVRPTFCVMDGTIGLEGNGPKSGLPRIVDLVFAGHDPVAVDTVAALVMGYDPKQIEHLRLCEKVGIGTSHLENITVKGDGIPTNIKKFRDAKHNTVSIIELLLRKSALRKIIFHTKMLNLMCFGAKIWYWVWINIGPGKKLQKKVLGDPYYEKLWRMYD